MKNTRRLGAFTSGLVLYSLALGISALLAEIRLPNEVYALLGGRQSTLFVVGESLAIALPVFAFAVGWGLVTLRPLRLGRRVATRCCLSGLGLAWFGWMIYGAVCFDDFPRAANLPITSLLLSSTTPPVWGLLNTVAVLAGALLAGSMVRLSQRRSPTAGPFAR